MFVRVMSLSSKDDADGERGEGRTGKMECRIEGRRDGDGKL